jgi:hypothetical protein
MVEKPSKEIDDLLADLQSLETGKSEQAIRRSELLKTSSKEIVTALLKIRETSDNIAIIDLTRHALIAPANQAILRKYPTMEINIAAEMTHEYGTREKENSLTAEKAIFLRHVWVRADVTVQWPPVCVRCGKPGEMERHLAEQTIPYSLLKEGRGVPGLTFSSGFPALTTTRANEYLAQHIQPPFCHECVDAIKKYKKVSTFASNLGFWIGCGVAIFSMLGFTFYFGMGFFQFLLPFGLGIAAGWGAAKIYSKSQGDPPRATTEFHITLRPEKSFPVEKIGFYFRSESYGELFRQANKSILIAPPVK